jgi:glutamine---fructose-6-phosphate transaminase (isomerizing)
VDPLAYLADLEAKPESLTRLADLLRVQPPFADALSRSQRFLFLGMGSSAYAGSLAAARLRHLGLNATAELASSDLLPPTGTDLVVVAVSASGSSPETLASVEEYRGTAHVIAVTERSDSALADAADLVVPLQAGPEAGGVACRSFQHTVAVLLALEAELTGTRQTLTGVLGKAIEATADLLGRRDDWLPEVASTLDGPDGLYVAAPARRLCSAQQSALMVREGPRRASTACETGDWNHVDVYLTKTLDYRLLLLPGSSSDRELLRWTSQRGSTVVAVGAEVEGVARSVRYLHDTVEDVRLLTEVLVAELVAQRWWAA